MDVDDSPSGGSTLKPKGKMEGTKIKPFIGESSSSIAPSGQRVQQESDGDSPNEEESNKIRDEIVSKYIQLVPLPANVAPLISLTNAEKKSWRIACKYERMGGVRTGLGIWHLATKIFQILMENLARKEKSHYSGGQRKGNKAKDCSTIYCALCFT